MAELDPVSDELVMAELDPVSDELVMAELDPVSDELVIAELEPVSAEDDELELEEVLVELLLELLLELPQAAVVTRSVAAPKAATARDAVKRIVGFSFPLTLAVTGRQHGAPRWCTAW